MNLVLKIYDDSGKNIVKSYESKTYDLMFGTVMKLMELLNRQGGVQQAAKAAAAGDASSLVELVNRLMKTDEGAQLVGRIEEQAQKAGLQ